jgi:hypothetical protein
MPRLGEREIVASMETISNIRSGAHGQQPRKQNAASPKGSGVLFDRDP